MYISGVLSPLLGFVLLLKCVSGTGLKYLSEESVRYLVRARSCPGQIVTGTQNSVLCNNADYFRSVGAEYTGSDAALQRCQRDINRTIDSKYEEWSMRMLDAAGKPSSGILEGNFVWTGDFYECLNTSAPATGSEPSFAGRYCMFNNDLTFEINHKNWTLPLSIGLCVPDTCDEDALANLTDITKKIIPSPFGSMTVTGIICTSQNIPWDAPAIIMLTIIAIFVFLTTIGTLVTIYERNFSRNRQRMESQPDMTVNDGDSWRTDGEENEECDTGHKEDIDSAGRRKLMQFLKCFCVLTNGAKILDTSNKAEFRCVHGVRFLSMSWVILGHTFAFLQYSLISSSLEALRRADTLAFEVIPHGILAVDSFFLLSGFLLTYLFLRESDKKDGQISWGLYYFHRYWRLTPVYAIVLGFDYALTKYVGEGPFWPSGGNEAVCSETWWWNMLYINNFNDKQCMGWSWFLANDMQFYVISPLFLYPLWRNSKIGLSIVSAIMLGTWICAIAISWNYNFFSGFFAISQMHDPAFQARMLDYFRKFYIKPYTRIGPYLIGVILGHSLYKQKDRKGHLSMKAQAIGWSVAAVVSLATIYGLHHTNTGVILAAFYNALAPSVFTAALSWVIFTCVTENGGFVNEILSHGLFVPLSRLTYSAYLVHPIIIMGFYQSLDKTLTLTYTVTTTLFLGFLIMSYMAAFVTSLLFEAPFMAVEKMFIKRN